MVPYNCFKKEENKKDEK